MFSQKHASPAKRRIKTLVKLLVSAACLAMVYRSVDFSKLGSTLRALSPISAVLIISFYALGQLLSSIKWNIFMREVGIERTRLQVIAAYCAGMFVNSFGFGTVGGDVTRAVAVRPERGKRAATVATVVADRIHGLGVLLSIAAIAILIVRPAVLEPFYSPTLAILWLVAFPIGWVVVPKVLASIVPESHPWASAAVMAARAFPKSPKTFAKATFISALAHTLQISMMLLVASNFAIPVSIGYLIAVVPLVNFASALPISINGIGVREAMYVALLTPEGVSREAAVSFGAIWIVAVTIVGALGGLMVGQVISDAEVLEPHPTETEDNEKKRLAVGQ